jgi:thiol-disulfide isomerase/thioredoxin
MKSLLPLVALAIASTLTAAHGAETAVPSHNLSEFKVGRTITGPAVDLGQAKGKAVFIDAWGIHCGPCLALMPEIEKMSRRYKDKLVVIGAHSQQGTDDEIKAVVKDKRVSYGITEGVRSPVDFNGLPFGFIFDADGALLFAGRPSDREFDKAIRKAVQSVSDSASKTSALDTLKRPK